MSFVDVPLTFGEVREIEYGPARVSTYGENNQYATNIAANVSFKLGKAYVVLSIADAQALLEALPAVLAQHDYAEFLADGLEAVAR
ncbi:hypothetical protein ACFXG4_30665 [Nocardia sp. NPDC059246]|uniref:hypothetical protein n=1 Tax=unclassified Nocardia TaxID=2637762 RepID=UPI003676321F